MRSLSCIGIGLLGLISTPSSGAESGWLERTCELVSKDLRRTTARLAEIASELPHMPTPPGVPSGTSSGFSTSPALPDQEQQWLSVSLPAPTEVDCIALFPAVSMGSGRPIEGFGFPKRFIIEADAGDGAPPWVVMDQTASDLPNPGIYPVFKRFSPRRVQHVRVKVLTSWQQDAPSVLALAELMLLSGNRNIAVQARVDASSYRDSTAAWQRSNLVDMSTPLGLPAVPDAASTPGYHSRVETTTDHPKSVTVELPAPFALDEVRLVPVVREGLPAWVSYGYPPRLKIELAEKQDFSDAQILVQSGNKDLPAPGRNLVVFKANRTPARYLRITSQRLWHRAQDFLFALAEVQAYAGDQNVASGAVATASDVLSEDDWSVGALTDGHCHRQKLVELPQWLMLLEKKRLLLAEQAQLTEVRTSQLSSAQDALVRLIAGLTLGLVSAGIIIVWRQKRRNRQEQERLRERLARDLHDDIGSNLGSISLLCNIVTQHPEDTTPHLDDFEEIQRIATESAESMRDMINLLNPRTNSHGSGDWLQVFQRLARRILRGLDLTIDMPAPSLRIGPDLENRRELYLLCKEALTNIARHAQATQVTFRIQLGHEGLELELRDNGKGFDTTQSPRGFGLANLRQRASQMHGQLSIDSSPGQGTTLTLHLARRRDWQPF